MENIAKHAGTVMDTLFCAVGSVGSLELPTGTGWISQRDIDSTGNTPPSAEDTQTQKSAHKSHIQPVKYRYLNKNLIAMIPKQNLSLFPKRLNLDPAGKVIWNKAKRASTITSASPPA